MKNRETPLWHLHVLQFIFTEDVVIHRTNIMLWWVCINPLTSLFNYEWSPTWVFYPHTNLEWSLIVSIRDIHSITSLSLEKFNIFLSIQFIINPLSLLGDMPNITLIGAFLLTISCIYDNFISLPCKMNGSRSYSLIS